MTIDNKLAARLALLRQTRTQMSEEKIQTLLTLDFAPAEHAGAGTLSDEEADELDRYLHIGNLLAAMQSESRRFHPVPISGGPLSHTILQDRGQR